MKKVLGVATLVFAIGGWQLAMAEHSNGNPRPGWPHDTIMIHVLKPGMAERQCQPGGHSLFLHYEQITQLPTLPPPPGVAIYITMIDWVDDGDLEIGEEPGAITTALDCDSLSDGIVRLQIRDTQPAARIISTQEWFIRMVGKPGGNFAFTTNAEQVTCTWIDDGPDNIINTPDDTITCTPDNWVELQDFNLAAGVGDLNGDKDTHDYGEGPCAKQVKGNGNKPGQTAFCNITSGFLVDVDPDGTGPLSIIADQFIFTVSCVDNLGTLGDESLLCPLTTMIWGVDTDTDSMAKAQVFVGHTGSAQIQAGKVSKP